MNINTVHFVKHTNSLQLLIHLGQSIDSQALSGHLISHSIG